MECPFELNGMSSLKSMSGELNLKGQPGDVAARKQMVMLRLKFLFCFQNVDYCLHFEIHKNLKHFTSGVDFINICSRAQDEKLFLANGVWQTAHRFGKWRMDLANLAQIYLVMKGCNVENLLMKLNGKFFAKRRRLFAWRTKFGEIDPRLSCV